MPNPHIVSMRLEPEQIETIEKLIHQNISVLKQKAESVFEKGDIQESVELANEADNLAEIRRRLISAIFQGTN